MPKYHCQHILVVPPQPIALAQDRVGDRDLHTRAARAPRLVVRDQRVARCRALSRERRGRRPTGNAARVERSARNMRNVGWTRRVRVRVEALRYDAYARQGPREGARGNPGGTRPCATLLKFRFPGPVGTSPSLNRLYSTPASPTSGGFLRGMN